MSSIPTTLWSIPAVLPIYKNGLVAGGVGVAGADPATVEYAGVAGTVLNGFAPILPAPGAICTSAGIALPFVVQTTIPAGESPGTADGSYELGPQPSPGPTPEGDLIAETGSTLGGLTLAQVQTIVQNAVNTANLTRAAIRLPEGARSRVTISVADLDGHLLALYRMPDTTMFSTDVAVAKARNVIYFSTATGELAGVPAGTAVTNRTIGFGAQPLYPSGINGTAPGPFFNLFQFDVANPCTQGHQPPNPNQNGVVFFPGSVPLFVNGKLVGGLGVSGDGVDQDDWVAASGAAGLQAPANIRADQIIIRNVRLPYQKFPHESRRLGVAAVSLLASGNITDTKGSRPCSDRSKTRLPISLAVFASAARAQAPPAPSPAAHPARPTPPTRDPNSPGYVAARDLPDGTIPPANADGDFILGPTHPSAPEMSPQEGVPQGTIYEFTMNSADSKIYPGIARDPNTFRHTRPH